MNDLGELLVADSPRFVLPKVQFDKVTVKIKRNMTVGSGQLEYVLELIWRAEQVTGRFLLAKRTMTQSNQYYGMQ